MVFLKLFKRKSSEKADIQLALLQLQHMLAVLQTLAQINFKINPPPFYLPLLNEFLEKSYF